MCICVHVHVCVRPVVAADSGGASGGAGTTAGVAVAAAAGESDGDDDDDSDDGESDGDDDHDLFGDIFRDAVDVYFISFHLFRFPSLFCDACQPLLAQSGIGPAMLHAVQDDLLSPSRGQRS